MAAIISFNNKKTKQKKRKKREYKVKKWLLFLLFIGIILLTLKSPFFKIIDITVEGNSHFSKQQIMELLHLNENNNIFQFYINNKFKDYKSIDPYINNIVVNIKLPKSVDIRIEERKVAGYVPYMGTFLCIDKDGQVVDNIKKISDSLPIIKGLDFQSFTLGNKLVVNNHDTFLIVLQISQSIRKYELDQIIRIIDINDLNNITLFTTNLEVQLGTCNDYDTKINILKGSLSKINMDENGVLQIKDINGPFLFTPI